MATHLTAAEIAAGKPTKEELFTKIKNNQEEFDSAIQQLQGQSAIDVFDVAYTGHIGSYELVSINAKNPVFKAPNNFGIVWVGLTLLGASTSGTLTMRIEKSIDDGANWTQLLSPSLTLTGTTVGSVSGAPSWVDDGVSQVINQNDLLRITFESTQVDQGDFHVSIYGELA